MKILHVLSSNKLSGAENVAADICMMFEDEVEMIYCSPIGEIESSLNDRNVKYFPIDRLSIKDVRRAISMTNPSIIHAHDVKATLISYLSSSNIPVISHLHVNNEDMSKLTIKSFLYYLLCKKMKHVIMVSNSCYESFKFRKSLNRKVTILRNILYSKRIESLIEKDEESYESDFVFMGRLEYQKNPMRVANIAAEVLKNNSKSVFSIIGEGSFSDEMKAFFKMKNVSERVIFHGQLQYPYKALQSTKCLILASRFEGTPIAVLEAMSLGVPVVSTKTDGMLELIEHNKNGYLSDFDDDLIKYISKVINEENVRMHLVNNQYKVFSEINDIKNYKDEVRKLYGCI